MTQEDVMRILDANKGNYMTAKEIKNMIGDKMSMRNVFRALSKITKRDGYEAELFFDCSNRTSTNALTKYQAKNEVEQKWKKTKA